MNSSVLFFDGILRVEDQIKDSTELYKTISDLFSLADDIPCWNFDVHEESAAAFKLALLNPDALIASVYLLNTYFSNLRRWPREWQTHYSNIKRLSASALASVYQPSKAMNSDQSLHVSIWVPWLPNNPNNNILRVVAGYLSGLNAHDDVIAELLVTNEISHKTNTTIPNIRYDARSNRNAIEAVLMEFGCKKETLTFAPPPFVDGGNLKWMRRYQENYNPDVVFVPNFEMSSAHIHGFSKSVASVYLQTSVRNRPPYDFTRYLYLGEKRCIDDSHINNDRWYYHPFGYENFGADGSTNRSQLGLNEEDLVIVTAGNRLEREIDLEIADIMHSLLTETPNLVWVLLGVQSETKILENLGENFAQFKDRIKCFGYVTEIGKYLALADIYVNPRRTGGAVTMALAVYGDTPVISFSGSDACNFLIPEMIANSADEYKSKLKRLTANAAYRDIVSHEQSEKFAKNHTISASSKNLIHHFKTAILARKSNDD